ncbi:hypothetical protein HMPREF1868_01212 [Olsenella sp. DNF00959]|nr:hypothetical protein HMPREF1868_01212 [Olsenella sp. DNF00959]
MGFSPHGLVRRVNTTLFNRARYNIWELHNNNSSPACDKTPEHEGRPGTLPRRPGKIMGPELGLLSPTTPSRRVGG